MYRVTLINFSFSFIETKELDTFEAARSAASETGFEAAVWKNNRSGEWELIRTVRTF